jgi:hypothetical protein
MMEIKADRQNKEVLLRVDQLGKRTAQGIREGFFELAKDLQQTANKEILRRPKGGRTYLIRGPSGRRRRHVASAPGETHANRSGALRRSMGWRVQGGHSMEFGYGVGYRAKPAPEYAVYVEDGTRDMAARPSLGNAVDITARNAEAHLLNGIIRANKK